MESAVQQSPVVAAKKLTPWDKSSRGGHDANLRLRKTRNAVSRRNNRMRDLKEPQTNRLGVGELNSSITFVMTAIARERLSARKDERVLSGTAAVVRAVFSICDAKSFECHEAFGCIQNCLTAM